MIAALTTSRFIRLALLSVAAVASVAAAPLGPTLEDAGAKAADITKQAKETRAQADLQVQQAKRAAGVWRMANYNVTGSVTNEEWRMVYSGQYERCYNIRFTDRTGVPGYPDSYKIRLDIYANGKALEALSNPGESTDVCGTKIHVKGVGYDTSSYNSGKAFFVAEERRP